MVHWEDCNTIEETVNVSSNHTELKAKFNVKWILAPSSPALCLDRCKKGPLSQLFGISRIIVTIEATNTYTPKSSGASKRAKIIERINEVINRTLCAERL